MSCDIVRISPSHPHPAILLLHTHPCLPARLPHKKRNTGVLHATHCLILRNKATPYFFLLSFLDGYMSCDNFPVFKSCMPRLYPTSHVQHFQYFAPYIWHQPALHHMPHTRHYRLVRPLSIDLDDG